MPIGSAVRHALGPFEPIAADLYRGAFIDLDDCAAKIAPAVPRGGSVLELGCGDGVLVQALQRTLDVAHITGIDPVHANPGRLFRGPTNAVRFSRASAAELRDQGAGPFDVVVLCDVLHHIEPHERATILRDAALLTRPGGTLAIKEWERFASPASWAAYVADRYVSGDATVSFFRRSEFTDLLAQNLRGWRMRSLQRVAPRHANFLVTLERPV